MKLLKLSIVFLLVISVFSPVLAVSETQTQTVSTQLSDSADSAYFPVLTDNYIVWRTNGQNNKIVSMNRKTEEKVALSSEESFDAMYFDSNWISDSYVLWSDSRNFMQGGSSFRQIYACETSGGDEFLVSDATAVDCIDVSVWENYAAFIQFFEDGTSGIYFCDLTDLSTKKMIETIGEDIMISKLQFYHGKVIWTSESTIKYYDVEKGTVINAASDAHLSNPNLVMNEKYLFYIDLNSNIVSCSFEDLSKATILEGDESNDYPLISNPDSEMLLFESWGTGGNTLYSYTPGDKKPTVIFPSLYGIKISDFCLSGENLVYVHFINTFKFIKSRNITTGQEEMLRGIVDENTYPFGLMIKDNMSTWYEKSRVGGDFKSKVFWAEVK